MDFIDYELKDRIIICFPETELVEGSDFNYAMYSVTEDDILNLAAAIRERKRLPNDKGRKA